MEKLSYSDRIAYSQNAVAAELLQLMSEKETNLALSADVHTKAELLALAETLGPEICVLKTHIDIIEDFDEDLVTQLTHLSQQHGFLIFEDRKFADIGNTVKQQYAGGIYHIAQWAHMINAHTVSGPGIITGLREVGLPQGRALLLLAEMSTAGNLAVNTYTQASCDMAKAHADFVMGFIARRRLVEDPGMLYMTPGIQLAEGKDVHGQQYITPFSAIFEAQTDIIIVGRGIISAPDPLATATHYRQQGWKAYEQRLA